jgi:endo-1,4-beta-xylanase
MQSRGREWYGTALTIRNDTAEQAIAANYLDFGSVTPENAMKWESTEPERGVFTFEGGDQVVAFAEANGQEIHCHTLVWHSQLAPWVEAGNFDNATLIEIMKDHIRAVAGRWKDSCTRWDVVNEALNENGTYRESVWYNTIGEAYIPIAFAYTHEIAPKVQLFYNDYNLEYNQEKTAGARRIVELIQSYGAPIDGVGFQAHLAGEPTETVPDGVPSEETVTSALQSVADLGVDVAYTELDIRMNTPATNATLATQAEAYDTIVSACLNVEACIGITSWVSSTSDSRIDGRANSG